MDSDRIEGKATDFGGKVKDAVGGLVGDNKTQAEGKADQLMGQAQDAYGSAKDAVRGGVNTMEDQLGSLVKERPVTALLAAAGLGYVLSLLTHRR